MIHEQPIAFFSHGARLAGRMFRNTPRADVRQPALIVTGSWLTVKEQMPATYAAKLAARGMTAFIFDFAGFGESEGTPRQLEVPSRKIADLHAAAAFLSTFSGVDPDRVGHLAICASAQYGLTAWTTPSPITHFLSVAGWFHDAASVAPFYGNEEGVTRRLAIAAEATERFNATGEVMMVPAYDPSNPQAAMFFPLDYYAQPTRGAVPAWRNEMSAMSWWYWLTFDGLRAAPRMRVPTLIVHSDGCVLPDNARAVHAAIAGPKRLAWAEGEQTDFYDRPAQVDRAIGEIESFFMHG
jgi:uncharacterized protein